MSFIHLNANSNCVLLKEKLISRRGDTLEKLTVALPICTSHYIVLLLYKCYRKSTQQLSYEYYIYNDIWYF
jgi:hypothetical protein